MSGLLSDAELDGIRADAKLLLGIDRNGVDAGKTQITIHHPDLTATFDADSGQYTSSNTLVYSGAAIVFPVVFRRSRQETSVLEDDRVRVYRAMIPYDAGDVFLEDILTVTACTDANFVGRVMRVIDVMYESEQGLRRIDVVDVADDGQEAYS